MIPTTGVKFNNEYNFILLYFLARCSKQLENYIAIIRYLFGGRGGIRIGEVNRNLWCSNRN